MTEDKNYYQNLIASVLGDRPVAYNPTLARICGSVTAGILLSQLLYWWDKKGIEETIYKTIEDIEKETALSRDQQDVAIKKLKSLGFLQVELRGVPATRHFKLSTEIIVEKLIEFKTQFAENPQTRLRKTRKPVTQKPQTSLRKSPKLIYTENTTENTQENTTEITNLGGASKNTKKGMTKLAEVLKAKGVPIKQKKSGLSKEWQDKAFRYAEKLDIKLDNESDKKRWLKIFKQAAEGRKSGNLESAYSYLVDHPTFHFKDNDKKLANFFYIYENGVATKESLPLPGQQPLL